MGKRKSKIEKENEAKIEKAKIEKATEKVHLTILPQEDVRPRRGGGEMYAKYIIPITERDIVGYIDTSLKEKGIDKIVVSVADFAEAIGMKLTQKDYDGGKEAHSIYWGSKFALYVTGPFVVEMGTSIRDEPLLVISPAPEGYQLPLSLRNKLSDKEIKTVAQRMTERAQAATAATEATEATEAAKQVPKESAPAAVIAATATAATAAAESKSLSLSEKKAIAGQKA